MHTIEIKNFKQGEQEKQHHELEFTSKGNS